MVLLASAAAVGVYMEATRARTPAPSPSAAPSVTAPATPPPRAATNAEMAQAARILERDLRVPAGDAHSPWALAHGIVAFGKDFRASDGRSAVDVIASYAQLEKRDEKELYAFPEKKGSSLVEPHHDLLVKTLLESGVALDRKLSVEGGKVITFARLVNDLRRGASMPETDAEWHHAAWLLSALVLADATQGDAGVAGTLSATQLARAALARLEQDQRVCTEYAGDVKHAFDPGSPLRKAKTEKTGIYGHTCGGLHLVQAVLQARDQLAGPALSARVQRQLGVLLFRYEAERAALATLLASHPDQGLILRVQQLKFFGHLLETLTLAKQLGLVDSNTEGGKRIDQVLAQVAEDLVRVVSELDRGGVYQRLGAIRKQREQTYLDLVGDGCHALRGLHRALAPS